MSGRKKPKKIQTPPDNKKEAPRSPPSPTSLKTNDSPTSAINLPEVKSLLSPLAKEFVPRGIIKEDEKNQETEEIIPLNNQTVEALADFVKEVDREPALFHQNLERLGFLLNEFKNFTSVVEFLFENAIFKPNVMHSVAKLLGYLISKLAYGKKLRENILKKCHNLGFVYSDNYHCGLLLFLSELYSQVKNDNGSHIDILKDEIVSLCNQIVENPTSSNIKNVAKSLKLVGVYAAENSSLIELNQLVDLLHKHSQEPQHTNDVRYMVDSVYQLKQSNWGKSQTESLRANFSTLVLDSPVHYGPDGVPLTQEELRFLDENLPDEDDDDEYLEQYLEVEYVHNQAELDTDFEQFLRDSEANKRRQDGQGH